LPEDGSTIQLHKKFENSKLAQNSN